MTFPERCIIGEMVGGDRLPIVTGAVIDDVGRRGKDDIGGGVALEVVMLIL